MKILITGQGNSSITNLITNDTLVVIGTNTDYEKLEHSIVPYFEISKDLELKDYYNSTKWHRRRKNEFPK